ncbi:hypothetical protein JCM10908_006167 [Rhodotorula pacifica]|uniref:uncharacterized protein n=1 Tax=Rhodotorula pacifica TaxID=1495444 RepID=UPI0031729A92
MEAKRPNKTARKRPSTAEPVATRTIGLTFLSSETPQALGPLPSFQDRLSATDTWNTRPWSSYSTSSSSSGSHAASAGASSASRPTSVESTSSSVHTARGLSWSTVGASTSSSIIGGSSSDGGRSRTRQSHSPEVDRNDPPPPPMSASTRRALRRAEDQAVQHAVAQGILKADSYTEGQVRAVKARAASKFVRSHAIAEEEHAESKVGTKRSRRHIDGRAGQVASAVKARRIDSSGRKRVVQAGISGGESGSGGEDDEEEPVEVEVDLRKLLGI